MHFKIKKITKNDKTWVKEVISHWLADFIITRGRKVYPAALPGFYAVDAAGNRVGLVTYEINGDRCEVITLDAFEKYRGIGTLLMKRVEKAARRAGCMRLWFITTNDNLDAIRFYLRRGYTLAAVHVNALEYSRKLKPSIPKVGNFGIPMRDEIEFEKFL
ncbi:MAG: GNAT family N-acetyltransferase [candidate division Zixibacteria bacterium]|nr:GNAT family N-acetyltransferase [candidate division Zixibacteria bacterium]